MHSGKTLPREEIQKRLIRLRNLEKMYKNLKKSNEKLLEENKFLKLTVKRLETVIETLLLRIDELEKMVFGGGKGGGNRNHYEMQVNHIHQKPDRKKRMESSYKRSVPKQVDKEESFQINKCPDCSSKLESKFVTEQYVEDIPLPSIGGKSPKEVTREDVEKGWCGKCRRWVPAKRIQSQKVILGGNVKKLVLFAIHILSLSFSQVQNMLLAMYAFKISDGEINNILQRSSERLLPEHQKMKTRIRGQTGNHYDETGWQEGKEKCYAWVQTGTESDEAILVVGKTRGKGVAEELKKDSRAVGITDCYSAYKNLFESHQICWAHLQRSSRDLALSPSLNKTKRKHCERFYAEIAKIYRSLLEFCKRDFNEQEGQILKQKLLVKIEKISIPNQNDPKKLVDLRERLKTYRDSLFICLDKHIPPDNNKAERKLRHLVLKRKKSFGTKTPKGSHAFSINVSVLMSLWWTDPKNWFSKLHSLLAT